MELGVNCSVNRNEVECQTGDRPIPILKSGLFFHLRSLDPTRNRRPIMLVSDHVHTVGRKRRHCEIVLDNRFISKRHCQIFLDSSDRKLRLIDGFFLSPSSDLDEIRKRFLAESEGLESRASSNGVFVNGRRIKRGVIVELSVGDEILFGCSKRPGNRCRIIRYGFVVERIEDQLFDLKPKRRFKDSEELVKTAAFLLGQCQSVLQSADPVSFLRSLESSDSGQLIGPEISDRNDISENANGLENGPLASVGNFGEANVNSLYCGLEGIGENGSYSDGKTFFLNRLESMVPGLPDEPKTVTLPELLHPVESLVRVFMATFTNDVSWFLSYCQVPNELPITIACHSAERCWSSSRESRTSAPYTYYPNLLLVYPPFPDVIAFGKDRKKRGVACHHPKLIVLQRKESMRVIVTSANLTPKQWNYVTNTVWWQDFPLRSSPDYSALFPAAENSFPDFASQLGRFIASLISDVPSQAHWIAELSNYDFRGAVGHLVASIPGIHVKKFSHPEAENCVPAKCTRHSRSAAMKYLGSAQVSVVGLNHRFHAAADSSGAQLKTLASFLGKFQENAHEILEVLLKRNKNIPADANAMSVSVADLDEFSEGDSVQLGFLPRDVAKWVSPLNDAGFFSFSAFIYPKETLAVILEGTNTKVPLLLHVSEGPNFSGISKSIQPQHLAPLCSLLASMQNSLGLWRLQEVLSQHKWPESLETDFVYGSSSIGTSVNPQFLAAFSSAAGKRSVQLYESDESDPEWGCWTANHESRRPSIRILFPTIERVKNGRNGIQPSRCLLSLPEKTWQRLRTAGIFCDAVPHPGNRLGYPMHVKVAQRRFQSRSVGIPPFGWIYCGSHNFSPAAWGQIILPSSGSNAFGPRLHICNYELGIIFIFPPLDMSKAADGDVRNIDDIALPFVMPPPKYQYTDRPATQHAMREALVEAAVAQREMSLASVATDDINEDIPDDDDDDEIDTSDHIAEEKEEEKIYAEMLWSQLDSSGS